MRIVAMSDTHGKHEQLVKVPGGDILIVAGDFLHRGSRTEIPGYRDWLVELPHKRKIVVAGNHDWAFYKTPSEARQLLYAKQLFQDASLAYLEDQALVIDGIKFYGSPWQPVFHDWAFNAARGTDLQRIWARISDDTDVLITHGPPYGIMDRNRNDERFGCEDLYRRVMEIKPKYHIFGHAHTPFGRMQRDGVTFYNVAICNERYEVERGPVIIEYDTDGYPSLAKGA